MDMLKAKKMTTEKFKVEGGYIMPGAWGVINTETNEWVTFNNSEPYMPVGNRKAAKEVADTCNPDDLNYVAAIS